MSILDPLAPYRTELELALGAMALLIISGLWMHHNHVERQIGQQQILAADKAATERQAKIDAQKLKEARDDHDKELDAIRKAYGDSTPVDLPQQRVCYYALTPNYLPEAPVHDNQGTTPAVVPEDPRVYRDRQTAFRLLLKRADGLSADTRQLNTEIQ